jgi:hypothetical protein
MYGPDLDSHSKFFAGMLTTGLVALGGTVAVLAMDDHAQRFTRGSLTEAFVVLLAPIAMAAGVAAFRQYALDRVFEERERKPDEPLSPRLQILDDCQTYGYTVYGGYRPFVGRDGHSYSASSRPPTC